jgi:Tfp pilus assembly PilM family ATPase
MQGFHGRDRRQFNMAKIRKALFLEISEYSVLAARTTGLEPPFVIEAVHEMAAGSAEEVATMVGELMSMPRGQYAQAVVGVYPSKRFVRRATMENPAKAKDPAFLADYVQQQFQVETSKYMVAVLNAEAGAFASADTGFSKELIFCGAPMEEMRERQQWVVSAGIYPVRMELGSVATVGGLGSYLMAEDIKSPTLLLEIMPESSQVSILRGNQLDLARPILAGINSMFPIVQQELGLKDEESARKLFYSNTFDFTEIGPTLLKKILKDLQSSTGFYEVQTGQTIGQIHLSLLPKNLAWMGGLLARSLGVDGLRLEYAQWLKRLGIEPAPGVELAALDGRWLGLFGLMGKYETKTETKTEAASVRA